MRGNKIAPLRHVCLTSHGTWAKGVQFYCPSNTYSAIPYCTKFSIFSPLCQMRSSAKAHDSGILLFPLILSMGAMVCFFYIKTTYQHFILSWNKILEFRFWQIVWGISRPRQFLGQNLKYNCYVFASKATKFPDFSWREFHNLSHFLWESQNKGNAPL